ncbi:translation initiation factor IF-2-like [Panicum virgatum]|uniref:translation initiation factor IF-2-like n=1 Tax=Panicum virgatum TaxID=38727 RepID=UPI0019D6A92C|nr:translation initiation factor IF-2-like [Panicum virgatum]
MNFQSILYVRLAVGAEHHCNCSAHTSVGLDGGRKELWSSPRMSPPNQVNAAASSCAHGCAPKPSPGPSHPRTAARPEGIPGRPGSEAGADGRARAPAGGGNPDFASTRGSKVGDGGRRGSSGTMQETRSPAHIHAPLEAQARADAGGSVRAPLLPPRADRLTRSSSLP